MKDLGAKLLLGFMLTSVFGFLGYLVIGEMVQRVLNS